MHSSKYEYITSEYRFQILHYYTNSILFLPKLKNKQTNRNKNLMIFFVIFLTCVKININIKVD